MQLKHGKILEIPISPPFLAIGTFQSGLLGNPIGRLLIVHFGIHPIHPWHKYLEWFPPEEDYPMFWVILELKIKRKKTLVRDKLFLICLLCLQSRWDFLGPNQ